MLRVGHEAVPTEMADHGHVELHHIVGPGDAVEVHHIEPHAITPRLDSTPPNECGVMRDVKAIHFHEVDPHVQRIGHHHHVHGIWRKGHPGEGVGPAPHDGCVRGGSMNPVACVVLAHGGHHIEHQQNSNSRSY